MRLSLSLLFSAALVAGCSSTGDSIPDGDTGAGGAPSGGAMGAGGQAGVGGSPMSGGMEAMGGEMPDGMGGAPAGDALDVSGTWAFEATVNAKLLVDLVSYQYFLVDFVQDGTTLAQTTTNCEIQLPSVPNLAELILPPGLLTLLQDRPFVAEGAFLSAAAVGATYQPDPQIFTLGVDFEGRDPFTDPLPNADDLTYALDEDEDGNPGVTVDVDAIVCPEVEQLFVAMRTGVEMEGVFDSVNTVSGDLAATLDQNILGSTDPCLDAAATLSPEVQDGSTFVGMRVDGGQGGQNIDDDGDGQVTCAELRANLERLFPRPMEE